eukprot:gene8504-328_t
MEAASDSDKFWLKDYNNAVKTTNTENIEVPHPALNILKVNQLDAELLDMEIKFRLNAYFSRIFMFFNPNVISSFQPELTLILSSLIYKFSIYDFNASFGDSIQNLKYRCESFFFTPLEKSKPPSNLQKIIHGSLLILVPYIWTRVSRLSISENWGAQENDSWKKKIWKGMNFIDKYFKIIVLFNFLVFLFNGRYRNIIDRIASMRLVYNRPLMSRNVSFDYMNRELIWNGFAEVILFIFPLINVDKIWNLFSKILPLKRKDNFDQENDETIGKCLICNDMIQIPYITNCNHIYCYYCLKDSMVQESFNCLRCGKKVSDIKRLEMK